MRYCEASSMIASSPEAARSALTDMEAWPSRDSGAGRFARGLKPRAGTGR
jgi:hypothetical protein